MAIINCISKRPNAEGEWEYNESVDDADFPETDWVHNPDVSGLSVDQDLWRWNGMAVVEMTPEEKIEMVENGNKFVFEVSGRVYCYTDDRWITSGDDNYGHAYYQWQESAGTNTDPIVEWEHMGHLVKKGEVVTGVTFAGRVNNTAVTEIELCLMFRSPAVGFDYTVGVDSDAEDQEIEVFRDNWVLPVDTELMGDAHAGSRNDIHRREVKFEFICPADGWLSMYYGPNNTSSSTRYFMHTRRIDMRGKT